MAEENIMGDNKTASTFNNLLKNLFNYFTGSKTGLLPSKYKPTKSTDKMAKYFTLPGLKEDVMKTLQRSKNAYYKPEGEDFNSIWNALSKTPEGTWKGFSTDSINLGHFKADAGYDVNGKYISFHDKYDWNLLKELGIAPDGWEFYDRIYENEFNK